MRQGRTIGVVIPTLNEEAAIGCVLKDLPSWVDRVIVADNGSTDATRAVAEAAGATVVIEPRRGYGAACQAGIAALGGSTDIIVFIDGDYSDDGRELDLLVDPIIAGHAQFVIGSRVLGRREAGALSPQQRAGNWLACHLIALLFGARFSDLGPFRAIDAAALRNLDMCDMAYGWTVEMQIKAARAKLAMMEVPVSYKARIGVSKISGTVRGAARAGFTILAVIFRSSLSPAPSGPPRPASAVDASVQRH